MTVSMAAWTALITALATFLTAVTGLIIALKAHGNSRVAQAVATQAKEQANGATQKVLDIAGQVLTGEHNAQPHESQPAPESTSSVPKMPG